MPGIRAAHWIPQAPSRTASCATSLKDSLPGLTKAQLSPAQKREYERHCVAANSARKASQPTKELLFGPGLTKAQLSSELRALAHPQRNTGCVWPASHASVGSPGLAVVPPPPPAVGWRPGASDAARCRLDPGQPTKGWAMVG